MSSKQGFSIVSDFVIALVSLASATKSGQQVDKTLRIARRTKMVVQNRRPASIVRGSWEVVFTLYAPGGFW